MTKLSHEQFAVVAREVESMMTDGDNDEVWRVLKMFADGRFSYRLRDFPGALQRKFAELGPTHRKSYTTLLDQIRSIANGRAASVFDVVPFGAMDSGGARYELMKIASKPAQSP